MNEETVEQEQPVDPEATITFVSDTGAKRTVKARLVLAARAGRMMQIGRRVTNPEGKRVRGSALTVARSVGKGSTTIESQEPVGHILAKLAAVGVTDVPTRAKTEPMPPVAAPVAKAVKDTPKRTRKAATPTPAETPVAEVPAPKNDTPAPAPKNPALPLEQALQLSRKMLAEHPDWSRYQVRDQLRADGLRANWKELYDAFDSEGLALRRWDRFRQLQAQTQTTEADDAKPARRNSKAS